MHAYFLQHHQLCWLDLTISLGNGKNVDEGFLRVGRNVFDVGQFPLDRQSTYLKVGVQLACKTIDGFGDLAAEVRQIRVGANQLIQLGNLAGFNLTISRSDQ
ncbi:hypothetical protein D3C73_1211010 [compost metagenome]